ncbi:hypothetical protein V1514DRAFT_361703 [Lipomyces japonicus]|uniref:uncharacterized protein n=1 Tax=Lipomyces japonicus TaxID=56871 RepID=UPI0034CF630B
MSLTFQRQDGHRGGRGGSSSGGGGQYGQHGQHGQHAQGYHRGGGRQQHGPQHDRPKKEAILDLAKYQDREIRVKFSGGLEVTGILKGYDQLMNLVLDDVVQHLRGDVEEDGKAPEDQTRSLGLVVVRGPLLLMISPVDGSEEIANPFINKEEDGAVI